MSQKINSESDLTLEVVIMLILGFFMFLFGLLLFHIHTGDLPYNPDGMYGLFLVIVSIQVITMGKTPFGDLRRSWAVIILGICAAILGMLACFIPGYLTDVIRIVVGVMLFLGGITLLFELFVSEKKAKKWMQVTGIVRRLIVACGLVYVLTIITGLITLIPGIVTTPQTGSFLLLYGMSFFYLAWCMQGVRRKYPSTIPDEPEVSDITASSKSANIRIRFLRETNLPLSFAIIILLGVLLVVLGILLFPVNLGLLPFSPDGQLGLLLVLIAIQMMALGNTPLGQFRSSWIMVIIGTGFASLGIISCIVPGILTGIIQEMLGILNIAGGAIFLATGFPAAFRVMKNPPPEILPSLPVFKKMLATQTALSCVSIAFGVSMLLPGLVSGFIISGIVIINGILLFLLVWILQKIS